MFNQPRKKLSRLKKNYSAQQKFFKLEKFLISVEKIS